MPKTSLLATVQYKVKFTQKKFKITKKMLKYLLCSMYDCGMINEEREKSG